MELTQPRNRTTSVCALDAVDEISSSQILSQWLSPSEPDDQSLPVGWRETALHHDSTLRIDGAAPELKVEYFLVPFHVSGGYVLGLKLSSSLCSYAALCTNELLALENGARHSQCSRFALHLETATLYSALGLSHGRILISRSLFLAAGLAESVTFIGKRQKESYCPYTGFIEVLSSIKTVCDCPCRSDMQIPCMCDSHDGKAAFPSLGQPPTLESWSEFQELATSSSFSRTIHGWHELQFGPTEAFARLNFTCEFNFCICLPLTPSASKVELLASSLGLVEVSPGVDPIPFDGDAKHEFMHFCEQLSIARACLSSKFFRYTQIAAQASYTVQCADERRSSDCGKQKSNNRASHPHQDRHEKDAEGNELELTTEQTGLVLSESKGRTRQYKCNECEVNFLQLGHLKHHMQAVHQKLRPHRCQQCGRAFAAKSKLSRHIKAVHERQRAFECPLCDSRFAQNWDLQRHIERVHTITKRG